MRLLLAEDEMELSRALAAILTYNRYETDTALTGTSALEMALRFNYDALILDIMMPGMNGIDVLKQIRTQNITAPVIMLTARAGNQDRITGLDSGADDYLTKPFRTEELLARLRALLRRSNDYLPNMIPFGNAVLNRAESTIANEKASFQISNKELKFLELLSVNPHGVASKEQILHQCQLDVEINHDQLIRVYAAYLNNKLASLSASVRIQIGPDLGCSLEEYDS